MCLFKSVQGVQGPQGKIGIQGTTGAQGIQGKAGSGVEQSYVDNSFNELNNKIQAINASLNNAINADSILFSKTDVPLTSTSPGIINSLAYDASYLYICVETDKWRRTSLNIW